MTSQTPTKNSKKQERIAEAAALVLASLEYLLNATERAHHKEWKIALSAVASYLALVLNDEDN